MSPLNRSPLALLIFAALMALCTWVSESDEIGFVQLEDAQAHARRDVEERRVQEAFSSRPLVSSND